MRYSKFHLWTQLGFCVVMADGACMCSCPQRLRLLHHVAGVGSTRRGVAFEAPLRLSMGMVELDDQIRALQHLQARYGLPDMSRVAVTGWSYGGYMSLMAIAQRPDIFKVGRTLGSLPCDADGRLQKSVACAPVTTWEAYDTGTCQLSFGLS